MVKSDVIIIGAGASGLMCAIAAGKRGRKVVVIDHAKEPANKILMSGGGRCNFTNLNISSQSYISNNPHFCKSALKQYTQWDFIELLRYHNIRFEERSHGQLFCLNSSREILDMLLKECKKVNVKFSMSCTIDKIERRECSQTLYKAGPADTRKQIESEEDDKNNISCGEDHIFLISTSSTVYQCRSLVIATGGLAQPSSGATPFGYQIAEQFGIKVWPPSAGLVPFTLTPSDKTVSAPLSGISVESIVQIERVSSEKENSETKRSEKGVAEKKSSNKTASRRDLSGKISFRENILFTHRGLSGPAILQISSYWHPGDSIVVNLLPDLNLFDALILKQRELKSRKLKSILSEMLPRRLITAVVPERYCEMRFGDISNRDLRQIADRLQRWVIKPGGSEGYRTAEVTVGGVDCDAISSKTMEAREVKGLFFTGELLDVTGWLGGYNLQWAWSSGWCAGQAV